MGIQDIDRDWLRSHIGMVTQEPVLFNTTIYENIRLGKPEATKEEIVRAAHDANAHSFIVEFGDGYDTYVGEGGIQLSGGQKQRIAIARALVRDPKILLLDEATSALDTISEGLVQSALEKARIGRTSLIVAHRLSTVQNADIILCINKGTVVEIGSHTDLMEMKGLYYNLVGTQLQHRQAGKPSYMYICATTFINIDSMLLASYFILQNCHVIFHEGLNLLEGVHTNRGGELEDQNQ